MKRRTFLALGGAAGAATVMGPWVKRSRAASFGEFPTGTDSVQLAERAKNVLEIFLYGGLSMWETLFFVREYGSPTSAFPNTQYYAYATENAAAIGACGNADAPRPFASDENGTPVELGPFAARLDTRPDIVDRMRLVVQRHNLEPHEAAVPMALTGRPVGQPNAAGLGAHVQRARIDAGATPGRASPHAYVFSAADITSDNVASAAAAGSHPGGARPLLVKTDNASRLDGLLARGTVGTNRASHDGLVKAYIDQYDARLTWPEHGRVRSPRADDLAIAFDTTTRVDAIRNVFPQDLLTTRPGTTCGVTRSRDITAMGLHAARHLLTHPSEPASYVCVSDTGLYRAAGGGGYDTHDDNPIDTAVNFDNLLRSLLAMINAPGEADPTKLDLDDTLIILNTEFGRTPGKQGTRRGRNHHPYGYVTAFIGGPVTTAHKGISGAIGPDGIATKFATPAENRMAALLALGIWPFAAEGFNVADTPAATNELDAAQKAMAKFLGRVS